MAFFPQNVLATCVIACCLQKAERVLRGRVYLFPLHLMTYARMRFSRSMMPSKSHYDALFARTFLIVLVATIDIGL